MNLFPDNPTFTRPDRQRLLPFLGNTGEIKRWIREDKPSTADLKRAVMIEVERGDRMRADAVTALLVAIQRYERSKIERLMMQASQRISRKRKP